MNYMEELGQNAKQASHVIAKAGTVLKNQALQAISDALRFRTDEIIQANQKDLELAVKNNMTAAMQDRLKLDQKRIENIANAVLKVAAMDDVIGEEVRGWVRPNGLRIRQVRVPMGVIGIIFESRPNVTVDAAVLCLKAGNAVILRGGKEAIYSNTCLVEIMRQALVDTGLPADCVQLVAKTDRETAADMMRLNGYLDVLIPRGGAGLIQAVVKQATVPVIETGAGNCHVYIDNSAELDMAVAIADNAKTQRPSVCNAIETLLVHEKIAEKFLPAIQNAFASHDVIIHGCEKTKEILGESVIPATEEDYFKEYSNYEIAIRIVKDVREAVAHILTYSTHHSECIVTQNMQNAEYFLNSVDSAAVYVNASTRFTDGEEFGFGAEIGISTQKLHARGPMGLLALTTTQYRITGDGQIRR
ncbi:MAG: glutamate-5-semialdehyde dehydrogenase [Oscillospiraceae bacterium]|nr:glutamate-5-semialdehyde dehydrogenase [Oscillospiraceae bacterium]MDE5885049.1 glutamate-5-semialdehyde dehydrogenase [Oscillospiraceae bacterium]